MRSIPINTRRRAALSSVSFDVCVAEVITCTSAKFDLAIRSQAEHSPHGTAGAKSAQPGAAMSAALQFIARAKSTANVRLPTRLGPTIR